MMMLTLVLYTKDGRTTSCTYEYTQALRILKIASMDPNYAGFDFK